MRTVIPRKGRIPRFQSDQEERDFWARHSVEEFAGELQDLDVAIRPSRTGRSPYGSMQRTCRPSDPSRLSAA